MPKYVSTGFTPQSRLPASTLKYIDEGAREGDRNNALFQAACQFRDAGYTAQVATGRLLKRARADGLEELEATNAIASAYREENIPAGRKPFNEQSTEEQPVVPSPLTKGCERLIEHCFREGEYIAISPAQILDDGSGRTVPHGGTTLTRERWLAKIKERGGIDKCYTGAGGVFVRVNPMKRGGKTNKDVTAFRHCLVEFDRDHVDRPIPREKQFQTITDSGLPVSALIDSGGKSLHAWVRVDAPDAEEYTKRVAIIYKHFEGRYIDEQNRNPSRYSRCPDARRNGGYQRLLAIDIGARSWDEWVITHTRAALPAIVSVRDFMAARPPAPPQVIEGILHQGSKMTLGGFSKARKTWSLMDMALSVSNGVPWWGHDTAQGRVLVINLELQPFAMGDRVGLIAHDKKIKKPDDLDLWNLRGYATDFSDLVPRILQRIEGEAYTLIIVDPIYKVLGNRDENAAGDIASLLNEVEQLAVHADAAVAFGAHFSKGEQAGKRAMDRIGGSGVFGRDPDTILTMTEHEAHNAYIVELALRALPEQAPFVIQWQGCTFKPVELDASAFAGKKGRAPGASYVMGDKTYRRIFGHMKPLTHTTEPGESDLLAYIETKLAECGMEDKEPESVFHQCRAKKIVLFDRVERFWYGADSAHAKKMEENRVAAREARKKSRKSNTSR